MPCLLWISTMELRYIRRRLEIRQLETLAHVVIACERRTTIDPNTT